MIWAAALMTLFAGSTAFAQAAYPPATTALPMTGAAGITAATVGVASAQARAADATRKLLAIDNESASATIACAFGATAALNTAGSFTIPAQQTRTWNSGFVPNDAINCIASGASTPVTIEVQ